MLQVESRSRFNHNQDMNLSEYDQVPQAENHVQEPTFLAFNRIWPGASTNLIAAAQNYISF